MRELTNLEKETIEAAREYIKTLGSVYGYKETVRRMIERIKSGKVSEEELNHLLSIYKNK